MENQHTPGPWRFVNGVQIRSHKHQIAKIWMMRNGEGSANGQLIAAAPELLEALQTLLFASGEQLTSAFEQAELAIAKATGVKNEV